MGLVAFIFALIIWSAILGAGFYMIYMAISNGQSKPAKKTAAGNKRAGKTAEILFALVALVALFVLVKTYWAELGGPIGSLWQGFPAYIVRWDVLIFIIFLSVVCGANLEVRKQSGYPTLADFIPKDDANFQTRTYHVNFFNYSATALKDVSSAYITAVSILIPASFVIIQVAKSVEPAKMPVGVTLGIPLLFRGVVWFLISLFFGILSLYRVFTHGRYRDLSRSFFINVFLSSQFISLFIGVLWLAAGLYYVVFR